MILAHLAEVPSFLVETMIPLSNESWAQINALKEELIILKPVDALTTNNALILVLPYTQRSIL